MYPIYGLAFAEGATLSWSTVSGAFTDAFSMVESAMNFIVNNSVFLVLFAAGLIPVGFKIFKRIKKAVSK